MAVLFPHEQLEKYFSEIDPAEICRDQATRQEIVRKYEEGHVFLLKNKKLVFDPQIFANVDFDSIRTALRSDKLFKRFKKFDARQFLDSVKKLDDFGQLVIAQCFNGDKKKAARFCEELIAINQQLGDVLGTIFKDYKILDPHTTWRLQQTVNEDLHIDVYDSEMPHHLRIFTNLDSAPRIWYTSYTLKHLLDHYVPQFDIEYLRSTEPEAIFRRLNSEVLGGYARAGRDSNPKHIAFFEPGDLWIVDSRKIVHQIFFGRKAVSTEYKIDTGSMLNPEQHYYTMLKRKIDQILCR